MKAIAIRLGFVAWAVCWALDGGSNLASERTILLADGQYVLYRSGTRRIVGQPVRHPDNPVIVETKPWELAIGYCSVYRNPETGKHQLWYQSYAGGRAKDPTRRVVVCYAESDDGLTWRKPNLGLYRFNVENDTNIVLVGNGGRSVNYGAAVLFDTRETDAAKRYKMAYWDFVKSGQHDLPGLCVAFSADGIRWRKHPDAPLLRAAYGTPGQPPFQREASAEPLARPAISDVIDLMFDPHRQAFVIYAKTWIDAPDGRRFWKRAVVRTESRDFVSWSPPQLVMVPADDEAGQLHGAPVFQYRGTYFGLLQPLDFGGFDQGGTGNMPAELAVSRDGIRWSRPFRDKLFLPVTGDGSSFDAGCLWTNAMPVFLKDEIRFYYGAYPGWHSDLANEGTGIGFASLPQDRLAGIQAGQDAGQVTLKPAELRNVKEIRLNADASAGEARVEVLTAGGYRIPGYAKDDCVPIRSDVLGQKVEWDDKSVSSLPPGKYQLRIHLRQAALFAVTIISQ